MPPKGRRARPQNLAAPLPLLALRCRPWRTTLWRGAARSARRLAPACPKPDDSVRRRNDSRRPLRQPLSHRHSGHSSSRHLRSNWRRRMSVRSTAGAESSTGWADVEAGAATSLERYSAVFLSTRSSAAATTGAGSFGAAGAADSHPVGSAEVSLEEEALVTAEAFSPNIPRALRRHCILTVTAQASLVSTAHTR